MDKQEKIAISFKHEEMLDNITRILKEEGYEFALIVADTKNKERGVPGIISINTHDGCDILSSLLVYNANKGNLACMALCSGIVESIMANIRGKEKNYQHVKFSDNEYNN